MSRQILCYQISCIKFNAVAQEVGQTGKKGQLIHAALSTFWTEHSERATLPTGLALLGTQKEERDMLGQWKPSGSDTYMRMYNGVIAKLQHQFAVAARDQTRVTKLDEQGVLESALAWAVNRTTCFLEEHIDEMLQYLEESMKQKRGPTWELPEAFGPAPPEVLQTNLVDIEKVPHSKGEKLTRGAICVVVQSGKRCRRLHKGEGGCWMGRYRSFKHSDEYVVMPHTSQYTPHLQGLLAAKA